MDSLYKGVLDAVDRLAGVAHHTPVLTSHSLDEVTGNTVFLKCENFQRMGAFKFRGAYNAIAKKDELKRQTTRLTRDVLDRALNSIASIYRDVAVLQNNAEDSVGLINLENRSSITELSVRLTRGGAVRRLEDIAVARRRLAGNGNPVLVFEALFCSLIAS